MSKTVDVPIHARVKTVPFLRTARLDLRPLRPDDARGPYLEWFNDPEVSAGTSHGALPYTEAAALAYIESVHDAPDRLVLAIERREDTAHIGNIALQEINARYRTAELAIVLGDRTAWGQGYAAEAARALCRHGFRALDLHRIGCGTFRTTPRCGAWRIAWACAKRASGARPPTRTAGAST